MTTSPTAKAAPQAKAQTGTPATPAPASKRGRKPGQPVKKHDTDFSLDFLARPEVVQSEDEKRKLAPQRERTTVQKQMDAVIEKAYHAWVAADKPSAWGKMPVVKYTVPPEKVDGLKYLIRRAADFHNVRPKFGTQTRDKDGFEVISFAVLDKRPYSGSESAAES